ncbi:MAG: TonB-dependent receptor [Acidobacteria bacterium]|nr:TonB-dependent receptor [Acidobacteriota bacterium]
MNRKFNLSVFALTLVLAFAGIVFGQETRGSIEGTVKDSQQALVPGANVEIKGKTVGLTRNVTSDNEGRYVAQQLPPGVYIVTASTKDLGAAPQEVTVTIGNATTLDFNLVVKSQISTVDVVADNTVIDTTEAKAQTNITSQQIEKLPKGTTFSSLLRTEVSTRAEGLAGGFQINGGSGAENSFMVDGQEVGNFRTGALNSNNDIPYQAVQEVQVKSSGFEAEFGGATGGVISVVTKSGTNDFRGEFQMAFQSQKLNAGPRPVLANSFTGSTTTVGGVGNQFVNSGQYVEYFGQKRDSGTNVFPTASLGGPIVKDKLWFYAIYSPQIFQVTRTTTYMTGFPSTTTPNARRLINSGDFATTLPDIVRNVNPIQTADAKQTNEYAMFKLDASPTQSLRLSASYTWNPIVQKGLLLGGTTVLGTPGFANFGGSLGYLVGADLAARQGGRQNSNNLKTEATWIANSKTIVGIRYSRGFLNEKLGSYFIPDSPRIRCRSVAAALAASAGCVTGFQTNTNNFTITKDVSTRSTIDADVSYTLSNFLGKHDFKFGYQFSKISNDVKDGYRNTGIVSLCYSTTLTINSVCGGYQAPVTVTPDPVPPAGQTMIGIGWVQRFATDGKASNTAQTFYAQDKWQPTSRLTLTLGLRTEKEDLPAFNGQQTNLKFGFGEKLAPRLGASYALTGDGKTKIAAFYGWFYDRLKFELPRGSFGGDFFRRDVFPIYSGTAAFTNYTLATIIGNYSDPIGGQCPIAQTTAYLTRCNSDFRVPSNLGVAGGGAVDPNLKPFRQSEFTFEFQRELMKNSILTARYLYRNVDHAVEDAGWISASGSETYIIANPGEGLHAQRLRELGYSKSVKPQRLYKALQLEYNSRLLNNFSFNLNYTYSSLYGNYSGLASSDENGRLSPGVNRFFDLPWVGWTASGRPDNGKLATDRPHVFKASGTYTFNWWKSKVHSTDLTFFTTAQSGTPITTFVDVFGLLIPETARGDKGRTPLFTQTDFSLTHKYRFGRDNRFGIAFDLNILNMFNEANVLSVDNTKTNESWYIVDYSSVAGDYVAATNALQNGGVLNVLNSETSLAGCQAYSGSAAAGNFCLNQSYLRPNGYQGPRTVRFGFRFFF